MGDTTGKTPRTGHIVLGATVRTLGAWPSGWRHPGAHRNPREDPAALARIAAEAEDATLDFLFFGDWLATNPDFEHSDPYLLARIDPLTAISYLAGITSRIGLIATVNTAYADGYAVARATASADILSGGRAGINLATSAEIRAARNFGWEDIHPHTDRVAAAGEVVEILRGLWDSWDDDAFEADAASGVLIRPGGLHSIEYVGRHRASAGPLNVVRPPQGHLPVAMGGGSAGSRDLAARYADISFVTPQTLAEATAAYAIARERVERSGRSGENFLQLAPILPIVAPSREEAWDHYDELVHLVPVTDASASPAAASAGHADLPANRSIRALAGVLGVPLTGVLLDEIVPARVAARFSDLGRALARTVLERSGRGIRSERPLTYRHLLVAHVIRAPIIVGSTVDIADHIELWWRQRAVDGFTVLSPYLSDEPDPFLALVVPELRQRGLFRSVYAGSTLRDHLGLDWVPSSFSSAVPTR
jgi:FMN-dependent oxidoreductase (nitrilotriacetate monooxygenase family)